MTSLTSIRQAVKTGQKEKNVTDFCYRFQDRYASEVAEHTSWEEAAGLRRRGLASAA
jgi:hypothetical protein